MAEKKDKKSISSEVLRNAAMKAALQTEGVAAMDDVPIQYQVGSIFSGEQKVKGVYLNEEKSAINITVFVKVKYGCRIPDTAFNLQVNIKHTIEGLSDKPVGKVDINIQGVI